jgi:5'-nucleotidase / UDP-sugar diphosphatase
MEPQASGALTLRMAESIDEVQRKGVPHVVDFTVLQLNDVYEAAPVEGGRRGGLARVATLRQKLAQENPNLLAVMAGDFLAPSAIGATTNDGGLHMIEALNAMGLTHATMGNHEFDLSESDLLLRIAESRFQWVVSNVTNGQGKPFENARANVIIEFANAVGEKVRVALLGLCIDMVKKSWLKYQNPIESARTQVAAIEGKADVFLTLTHLTIDQDKQLGETVPRLDVLLGGHEHEAARAIVGEDATPIFKADSNARTAFVHRFRFDTQTGTTLLYPELVAIDDSLEEDPATAAVVRRWEAMTYATLRAQGSEPLEVVGRTAEPLNGAEADLRKQPTNLGQLVAETFLAEVPDADGAVLGAGLIRIDGIIPPGDILYFDVVRIFPVGGKLSVLTMPGRFLRMLIDQGAASAGTGGFMIFAGIRKGPDGAWLVKDAPLADDTTYKVVTGELPAAALAYPPFKGSGTAKLYDTREMRAILTDRLRRDRATSAG